jgi:uncharacterized protein (UPF0548 family)
MTRRVNATSVNSASLRSEAGGVGLRCSARLPDAALIYRYLDIEVGKGGKDGKDADGPLTDWEAAGVEGIRANADLITVEPAVSVAICNSRVRAECGFVRVQQSITV